MAFVKRHVDWAGIREYQVYVPKNIETPSPAILFLHGMGESGSDNEVQTHIGLGRALLEQPDRWPFISIFPQKHDSGILWPYYAPMLNQILRAVEEEFSIDPERRYLTGLSQGGNGSLTLFSSLIWQFAAVAPICGWADPRLVQEAALDLPMWLFHGSQDPVVPASCSLAIYEWMLPRGSKNKKLTLFPEADHNSWDDAYLRSDLPEWFLSHPTK